MLVLIVLLYLKFKNLIDINFIYKDILINLLIITMNYNTNNNKI